MGLNGNKKVCFAVIFEVYILLAAYKSMKIKLGLIVLSMLFLGLSLTYWLMLPNNFVYTLEPTGVWDSAPSAHFKASGYSVRLNAECAKNIYEDLEKSRPESNADFMRFIESKNQNVEFKPEEIAFPSRFKWLSDQYITYNDNSLKTGIRFSFRNKCLYDKECLLSDSIEYLFIKIGIRYFLNEAQADFLKQKCIQNEKVYYRIERKKNFGRSERYYRNGIILWIKTWYNALVLGLLILLLIKTYRTGV